MANEPLTITIDPDSELGQLLDVAGDAAANRDA